MRRPSGRHSISGITKALRAAGFTTQCYGRAAEQQQAGPLRGAVVDSRESGAGLLFVARRGEWQDGHNYITAAFEQGCRHFLVARDWAREQLGSASDLRREILAHASFIAVGGLGENSTEEALYAWARAYRRSLGNLFVLAISGSYGKTSTKELLGRMLCRRYLCHITEGNRNAPVGCALTLLGIAPESQVALLELGIDRPREMDLLCSLAQPNAALLTGIGSAHLGSFASQEELAREKARIYAQLWPFTPGRPSESSGGSPAELAPVYAPEALLPEDDRFFPALQQQCPRSTRQQCYSGRLARRKGYAVEDLGLEGLRFSQGELHCELPLLGLHSQQIFWAAAAAAERLGLGPAEIFAGASGYRPLFGRGELLRRNLIRDPEQSSAVTPPDTELLLLQDCYNASPESVYALIEMLGAWRYRGLLPPCVLLLADMLELGAASTQFHRRVAELLLQNFSPAVAGSPPLSVLLYGCEMRHAWQRLQAQLQAEEPLRPGRRLGPDCRVSLFVPGGSGRPESPGCLEHEAELGAHIAAQLNRFSATVCGGAERSKLPLLVLKGARAMHLEKIAQKILR